MKILMVQHKTGRLHKVAIAPFSNFQYDCFVLLSKVHTDAKQSKVYIFPEAQGVFFSLELLGIWMTHCSLMQSRCTSVSTPVPCNFGFRTNSVLWCSFLPDQVSDALFICALSHSYSLNSQHKPLKTLDICSLMFCVPVL